MLEQLLIASSNAGKIREIQAILADLPVRILSIDDLPSLHGFDVEETGQTFSENAVLKARSFAARANLPTIGDDSGLEVQALDGFPGVHSNRWFDGTTEERNQALLEKLAGITDRRARFVGVVAFFDPVSAIIKTFEGVVEGQIALAPRGDKMAGFGYDPVFIPDGYEQTFAELGPVKKNQISHRRQALLKLAEFFLQDTHLGLPVKS